jgi:hypothetical protein
VFIVLHKHVNSTHLIICKDTQKISTLQARRIYVPLTVEINIFLTKTEDNKNEDIHVPKMNIWDSVELTFVVIYFALFVLVVSSSELVKNNFWSQKIRTGAIVPFLLSERYAATTDHNGTPLPNWLTNL